MLPYTNSMPLDALVKKLQETFNTSVDRYTTEREMLLKIGQQEVIDYLIHLRDKED